MTEPLAEPNGTEVVVAEPPQARGRLDTHEFDFVAMALTNAVPLEDIAHAVQVDVEYIRKLSLRYNESFNRVWDGYRNKLNNSMVAWRFKLANMLDKSYQAIENALDGKDPKLAFEAAKWNIAAVIPEVEQGRAAAGPGLQVNFNTDATVQAQVAGVIQNIGQSFLGLKEALSGVDLGRHVRQGEAAIVRVGTPVTATTTEAAPVGVDFTTSGGTVPQDNTTTQRLEPAESAGA